MQKNIVIAGAGPAGLTAALELLRNSDCKVLVLESDTQVGGISKTVVYRGNRMDLGGHRFFSKSDWVMNWWQQILPVQRAAQENVTLAYQGQQREFTASQESSDDAADRVMLVRPRLSRIFYRRKFFDYPIALSAATIGNLGLWRTFKIGLSYLKAKLMPRNPEVNLEDFFINRFGDQLYRTFFKDYTEKVWGVSCQDISAEWGAQRVKGLSITTALVHAFKSMFRRSGDMAQKDVQTSLIERFLYPKFGPGQMWEEVQRLVEHAGGRVCLRHRVVGLRREANKIVGVEVRDLSTGETQTIGCDEFISTLPLNELVSMLQPENKEVADVARALPYRDFISVGLVVKKMRGAREATPLDNWIYIQEPDVKIGRLQIFNNWSPALVADPNTVSLGLEYFCAEGDALWTLDDAKLLKFASLELHKIGLINLADVLDGHVVRVPKAYPAYFGEYRHIGRIRQFLNGFDNLYPIGRNGMHRYNNQDHSMLAAKAAVDCILGTQHDKQSIWAVNTEEEYHEEKRDNPAAQQKEAGDGARVRVA